MRALVILLALAGCAGAPARPPAPAPQSEPAQGAPLSATIRVGGDAAR